MRTEKINMKRVFNLYAISEEEGKVLRTLLNLSEVGVKNKLLRDRLYWCDDLKLEDAIKIGEDLCNNIMNMVDSK